MEVAIEILAGVVADSDRAIPLLGPCRKEYGRNNEPHPAVALQGLDVTGSLIMISNAIWISDHLQRLFQVLFQCSD